MKERARSSMMIAQSLFLKYLMGLMGAGVFVVSVAMAQPVGLKTFATHSRLEFELDLGTRPEWKDRQDGFELNLPGLGLADLGAPLGSEKAWAAMLQRQLKDYRLRQIEFFEDRKGIRISGKWRFPEGTQALADPKMEKFVFRDRSPARFVVDFWVKPGPTVAEAQLIRERKAREAARRLAKERAQRRQTRLLASQKSKNFEELTEFCRTPMTDETELFLSFQPVREKLDLSRFFPRPNPDEGFIYSSPRKNEEEGRYVKLATDLYRQGKFALTVKTVEFMFAEHPKSPHRHEMEFLKANAFLRLGMTAEAMRMLKALAKQEGVSEAIPAAAAYVAFQEYEQGDVLGALESFLDLSRRFPNEKKTWVYRLGAAEALYALGQTERAVSEYQWVAAHAPDSKSRSLAAFRVGDSYLIRRQYERSLAAYFEAVTRFTQEAGAFSPVHLNRAESLYGLGQMDAAEREYKRYLSLFPSHPDGWRATVRLGEISGRKSGEAFETKSRDWFLKTINQYPYSPGALIARARLIPCENHAGFSSEMSERFFEREIPTLLTANEIVSGEVRNFIMLQKIRALIGFGEDQKAVQVLLTEIQDSNISGPIGKTFKGTFWALLRKATFRMLAEGKKYEALNFYHRTTQALPVVLLSQKSGENDYLWKLSEAASELGLSRMAMEIARQAQERRSLASEGKGSEQIDRELKTSEESYVKAKALWLKAGDKNIDDIKFLLGKIVSESQYSYEKEILMGLIEEQNEKYATALSHALKAQILNPDPDSQKTDDGIRIDAWVARLQSKAGRSSEAIEVYRKLKSLKRESKISTGAADVLGLKGLERSEEWVVAEGDLLGRMGKWGEAARAYSEAIDRGLDGSRLKYHYAMALLKTGRQSDKKIALETLEKIAGSQEDDFWKKLAMEALAKR